MKAVGAIAANYRANTVMEASEGGGGMDGAELRVREGKEQIVLQGNGNK